jgi:hypothetical protein
MNHWNLTRHTPLSLTLAADARFCQSDFVNDHIWELSLGHNHPAGITVHTTYGLRAQWIKLFPIFHFKQQLIQDPKTFHAEPNIQQIYPNYISLQFFPFDALGVTADYWICDSHTIAGRYTFENQQIQPLSFGFEWACLLAALGTGESMAIIPAQSPSRKYPTYVLQGRTGKLAPVCCTSGKNMPGICPFPSLRQEINLMVGEQKEVKWVLSTKETIDHSHQHACGILEYNWDAEFAKIQIQNQADQLEILTGDADWDACLAQSQKTALGLIYPGNSRINNRSFVLNREPDQGYSIRGDGTDYNLQWSGQTPLDTYYLFTILPNYDPLFFQKLLENFLDKQSPDGFIALREGLGGQKSRSLAQPLLATIARRISEIHPDPIWLSEIYPKLKAFLDLWLSVKHDRDGDGYPEWDNPSQSGFPESPLYQPWSSANASIDINCIEAPSLIAMLYVECQSMIRIAEVIGKNEDIAIYRQIQDKLKSHLVASWSSKAQAYRYRDYQSHFTGSGKVIREIHGNGHQSFNRTFSNPKGLQPQRLIIQLKFSNEHARPIKIQIRGKLNETEIIEEVNAREICSSNGMARYTSKQLYTHLSLVHIDPLFSDDTGWISTSNFTIDDLSLYLPLWAKMCSVDKAEKMIKKSLLRNFLKTFGMASFPYHHPSKENRQKEQINLIWNTLIGEGLLNYGYFNEAADLTQRLMTAIIRNMKRYNQFHDSFHPTTAEAFGSRNSLSGLAPVSLILRTAGIKKLGENFIQLDGNNPYPWPIIVKYKGKTITKSSNETTIRLANGESITVLGPGPHHIELDGIESENSVHE